jgi:hypothetical protein
MIVHVLNLTGTKSDLYAEALRLLEAGAGPDDVVEYNGQKMNGTLAEIAGTFVSVRPDGRVEVVRTGAAAEPSAKFRLFELKADNLVTGRLVVGGFVLNDLPGPILEKIAAFLRKLINPYRRNKKQQRAELALHALYGDQIPGDVEVTSAELVRRVEKWCDDKGYERLKKDVILRAAGRRLV